MSLREIYKGRVIVGETYNDVITPNAGCLCDLLSIYYAHIARTLSQNTHSNDTGKTASLMLWASVGIKSISQ